MSEVQCDHIDAIGNTIPNTLDDFLKSFHRLHSSNLQILCKKCHRFKTKEDVFQKKRTDALIRVSTYLEMFPSLVNQHITDGKVLIKFDRLILKIQSTEQNSKYIKQLDKLKEKYL